MKRITILFVLVAVLAGCKGREWDGPEEELREYSEIWASLYLYDVIEQSVRPNDTIWFNGKIDGVSTTLLRDTLYSKIHYSYNDLPKNDSVDVTSTLLQIRDSVIIKSDGYRYSQKYWAHLFTVDPGIINYEGKYHIDFYEIVKDTPWAWAEVIFTKNPKSKYKYNTSKEPVVGWY